MTLGAGANGRSPGFRTAAAQHERRPRAAFAGSTITVTVNGIPLGQASSVGAADGWTYYGDSNSIYFGDDVIPEKGDRIEVHYTAVCHP